MVKPSDMRTGFNNFQKGDEVIVMNREDFMKFKLGEDIIKKAILQIREG
jgi:translation elongation factor P/translation initiation factor 5A